MTKEEAYADKLISRSELINIIYDEFDKKNSCDGCIHKDENEVMDYSCFECSRYYADKFEKRIGQ